MDNVLRDLPDGKKPFLDPKEGRHEKRWPSSEAARHHSIV
jgi:hypothetical protein